MKGQVQGSGRDALEQATLLKGEGKLQLGFREKIKEENGD